MAQSFLLEKLNAIGTDDSRGLLSPMLEGVQTEIGVACGLFVGGDPEHAAFVVKLVAFQFSMHR